MTEIINIHENVGKTIAPALNPDAVSHDDPCAVYGDNSTPQFLEQTRIFSKGKDDHFMDIRGVLLTLVTHFKGPILFKSHFTSVF